ncbi:hypothetical protein F5X96DRAFT_515531 [Biscogniauxia mediterranea]|nr:hypothetical protein F5X96DRAFT_515531 [Biscogniauxia mediterranea]
MCIFAFLLLVLSSSILPTCYYQSKRGEGDGEISSFTFMLMRFPRRENNNSSSKKKYQNRSKKNRIPSHLFFMPHHPCSPCIPSRSPINPSSLVAQ